MEPKLKPARNKGGGCHTVALPFTLKRSILRQKKNYGNSNISPCQNIIFKKCPLKEIQNPSRYYKFIIFWQKKNYGNSNISPCQNIIFKKHPLKEIQNPSRYYKFIIFWQKKNYGNSNISPCQNIIFKKCPLKDIQNPSRYYKFIIFSSFNTSQNIMFQKPLYKNRPIVA